MGNCYELKGRVIAFNEKKEEKLKINYLDIQLTKVRKRMEN